MLEREILGCFLKDNSLVLETELKPIYFENMNHQLIFTSMLTLATEGKGIDRITLMAENYDYVSQLGADFLLNLETSGSVNQFETYQKQIIERYKKREAKRLASKYLNEGKDPADLVRDLQEVEEIGTEEETSASEVLESLSDLPYTDFVDESMKTNIRDLDKLITGLEGATSYIIGARPSIGKTAVMLKLANEVSKAGYLPLMFSLEMPKEQLIRRLIAMTGNINLLSARTPNELTDGKKQAWTDAVEQLRNMPFEIFDKSAQTISYIRAQVRKAKRQNKKIVVLIDYLTLINTTQDFQSEHARIGQISKDLKNIARDYDCPVVTLAQLSRKLEARQDKRPMMSDLRESGSIEEDADVIMFLYRDDYYDENSEKENILEINIAKNRNGPTGNVEVYYQKETGRIADIAYN